MGRNLTLTGIAYVALSVRDIRRSSEWYQRVLGLKLKRENIAGSSWPSDLNEVLLQTETGGLAIGLISHPGNDGEPFDERRSGLDHLEFAVATVEDLRAWEDRLEAAHVNHSGVKGHILTFRDPDNIQLEFFCRTPDPVAAPDRG